MSISTQEFETVHLSEQAMISEGNETITPSNMGTVIDYLTRSILLADEHAFDLANIELKRYVLGRLVSSTKALEVIKKEERIAKLTKDISDVDDIPNDVFKLILDICSWKMAYRSGTYVKPKSYPDMVTVTHIKMMLKRIENFFDEYGWPIREAFSASTKNKCLIGDGDYLLKNTLVDLKASNKTTMQPFWVR